MALCHDLLLFWWTKAWDDEGQCVWCAVCTCASILLVINQRQLFLKGPRASEVACWNRLIFLKIVAPTKKQRHGICCLLRLQLFFKKSEKLHCSGLCRNSKLWGQRPKQHRDPFLLSGRADSELTLASPYGLSTVEERDRKMLINF